MTKVRDLDWRRGGPPAPLPLPQPRHDVYSANRIERLTGAPEPHPQDLIRELLVALGDTPTARDETPAAVWAGALERVVALRASSERGG